MPGTQKPKKAGATAASKPNYALGLVNKSFDLELPSGAVCLAIRPGAQGLIKAGLLDSLDQLTGLVQGELIDIHDPKRLQQAVKGMTIDSKRLAEGLDMVDRCIAHVVQEPKVWLDEPEFDKTGKPAVDGSGHPVYKPRQPGKIYADMVDLEDKMFIFNWAMGGTADLKSFRDQLSTAMGDVSAS